MIKSELVISFSCSSSSVRWLKPWGCKKVLGGTRSNLIRWKQWSRNQVRILRMVNGKRELWNTMITTTSSTNPFHHTSLKVQMEMPKRSRSMRWKMKTMPISKFRFLMTMRILLDRSKLSYKNRYLTTIVKQAHRIMSFSKTPISRYLIVVSTESQRVLLMTRHQVRRLTRTQIRHRPLTMAKKQKRQDMPLTISQGSIQKKQTGLQQKVERSHWKPNRIIWSRVQMWWITLQPSRLRWWARIMIFQRKVQIMSTLNTQELTGQTSRKSMP